jgi:two-component system, OmpR family, alkaline phosphatase synthesis response regulator PhoP
MDNKKILVIEDEKHIAEGIKLNLTLKGYKAQIAFDGNQGIELFKSWRPALIILDIMLPGIDGLSVLQNIRLDDERVPIMILSAKSDTKDKIKGLKFGVDDYMAKPFDLEEFLLRIERLMARSSWTDDQDVIDSQATSPAPGFYQFGKNKIDFEQATAHCKKGEIRLTEQEIKLLKLFIQNRGKPLSRSRLLEVGWGYTSDSQTRTVDNFIVRFRKYFEENPRNPVYFQSLRSVGYIFKHD